MIRQRVDRHGNIFQLEPASELPGCCLPASEVGVIKEGPVKKWMKAKREWDTKFASAKRKVQKQRAKEMAQGYQSFGNGEVPPPSALAGRRKAGENLKEEKKKKSMGMSMWSLWGSKHDEMTIEREKQADTAPETTTVTAEDGAGARPLGDTKTTQGKKMDKGERPTYSRSRSRRRTVTDEHQTGDVDENTAAFDLLAIRKAQAGAPPAENHTPTFARKDHSSNVDGATLDQATAMDSEPGPNILIRAPTNDEEYDLKRPKAHGIAFPFTVKGHSSTASMTTLTSVVGVPPVSDVRTPGVLQSGVPQNKADVEAGNSTGNSTELAKAGRELESIPAVATTEKRSVVPDTASTNTLTSAVGVPPATDVRIPGVLESGVPLNKTDVEAVTATSNNDELVKAESSAPVAAWKENGATVPGDEGKGKAIENGEIVSAERPPMETFVTATDFFPTAKAAEKEAL